MTVPHKAHNEGKRASSRQRAAGLRLVQLWVPDTRSKRFAAECRRQSRLLTGDPAEAETLQFIERAGAWEEKATR